MGYKQDLVAALGEFVGTTLFLFLALGGAKTAQFTRTSSQTEGLATSLGNQDIMFIAISFGMSLLVTAWVFYRVTGGLFNPAITFALYLIGGVSAFRASLLLVSQILGGIAASALVAALTPFGGSESLTTTLGTGVNVVQGLFLEAFLTAILVLTVLLLAAEKHKSTYLAPVGIGLVLLACHLFGTVWTGCGINPARAFGPSVVAATFPGYHWIYWLGPFIGSILAVGFYLLLKVFDYTAVVFGQDADHDDPNAKRHVVGSTLFKSAGHKVGHAGHKVGHKVHQAGHKAGLGRVSRKVVVFHSKKLHRPSSGESGETTVPEAGRVMTYDANDTAMEQAIAAGDATVMELDEGYLADMAEQGMIPTHRGIVPADTEDEMVERPQADGHLSMGAAGQDGGGLQAPGTASSGLANLPFARNLLR